MHDFSLLHFSINLTITAPQTSSTAKPTYLESNLIKAAKSYFRTSKQSYCFNFFMFTLSIISLFKKNTSKVLNGIFQFLSYLIILINRLKSPK